jgi:hypothetical protein
LNLFVVFQSLINTYCLMKEILVVNIKTTYSSEREKRITKKEDSLIPLYRDLDASTRNLKDIQMHPIKFKIRRHVCTMGKLDMWRRFSTRRETIYKRRLNSLKEMRLLFVNLLIISPSKSELLKPCFLIL